MTILAPEGLAGCAIAAGTAAAPGARHLLGGLMRRGALAALDDFSGPDAPLCVLTFAGAPRLAAPRLAALRLPALCAAPRPTAGPRDSRSGLTSRPTLPMTAGRSR